jgi:hypothetical protein
MALPKKSISEKIKDNYSEARALIEKEIIETEEPDAEVDLTGPVELSAQLLGDYVNLDWEHRGAIIALVNRIRDYANDKSRSRPLNIMMQAEPGSGKSHFIKCLAKSRRFYGDVGSVTFNMAGMQSVEDLIQPLDAVRNLKVLDKTPILFLDEVDSDASKYALLLPLLWDGELHVGHRDLKTGKVVIILAASGASIDHAMKNAKSMQKMEPSEGTKLVDLLSRINGGELAIPELDAVKDGRDRRTDKVCIAISLLKQRYSESLETVPWPLLHFIALTKFRYGVRSITHLIELLPAPDDEKPFINVDKLPLQNVDRLKASSLAYHLISDDGPAAVMDRWKTCAQFKEVSVRIAKKEEEEVPF